MAAQQRGSADAFRRRKEQDRERKRERGYRREVPHGQDEEAKRAREEALLKRKNAEPCDLCGERGHWKRECPKAREGRRQKPKSGYFCRSFALQATQDDSGDDRGPADEAEASPLLSYITEPRARVLDFSGTHTRLCKQYTRSHISQVLLQHYVSHFQTFGIDINIFSEVCGDDGFNTSQTALIPVTLSGVFGFVPARIVDKPGENYLCLSKECYNRFTVTINYDLLSISFGTRTGFEMDHRCTISGDQIAFC